MKEISPIDTSISSGKTVYGSTSTNTHAILLLFQHKVFSSKYTNLPTMFARSMKICVTHNSTETYGRSIHKKNLENDFVYELKIGFHLLSIKTP